MSRSEEQFFELLRAGLWGRKADASIFEEEVNWKFILGLAEKQTVIGLVAEGVYTLPEEIRPAKEIQYKLHMYLVRMQQSHMLLNQVLKELVTLFDSHHIPHVLLKGQGLAQIYPKPERRGCGDIDLYVGEENYLKACELVKGFGTETEEKELESVKHFNCHRNGVTIEIHRLAENQFNMIVDRRFQEWTKEFLDKSNLCRTWDLDGTTITLPPVQFDALYILNHLTHHFVSSGVGLRQICDWVRFLEVYQSEIDYDRLYHDIHRMRMWNFWQVFGGVAVKYLGFPKEKFPFYQSSSETKAVQVWKWIAEVGNFGKHAATYKRERPTAYLLRKLNSFFYQIIDKRQVIKIFPKETLDYMWWYVIQGIWNVILRK